MTVVVDSSCWIEILIQGKLSKKCEQSVFSKKKILIPTLVLFEVYKKIAVKVGESQALSFVGYLSQNEILDLDRATALYAADLSRDLNLPMADSIVLAHARLQDANLITMDNDFAGLDGVVVIR